MKLKAILLVIVGMMLAAAISVAEVDKEAKETKGAEEMQLFGGKKGIVPFPHHKHQETLKDCKVCHDAFPQEAGSIEKLKAEGKLKTKQVMNTQCVKCHKQKKKAGEKTGPTSCSKCHQKK